jgi:hypothetical protein
MLACLCAEYLESCCGVQAHAGTTGWAALAAGLIVHGAAEELREEAEYQKQLQGQGQQQGQQYDPQQHEQRQQVVRLALHTCELLPHWGPVREWQGGHMPIRALALLAKADLHGSGADVAGAICASGSLPYIWALVLCAKPGMLKEPHLGMQLLTLLAEAVAAAPAGVEAGEVPGATLAATAAAGGGQEGAGTAGQAAGSTTAAQQRQQVVDIATELCYEVAGMSGQQRKAQLLGRPAAELMGAVVQHCCGSAAVQQLLLAAGAEDAAGLWLQQATAELHKGQPEGKAYDPGVQEVMEGWGVTAARVAAAVLSWRMTPAAAPASAGAAAGAAAGGAQQAAQLSPAMRTALSSLLAVLQYLGGRGHSLKQTRPVSAGDWVVLSQCATQLRSLLAAHSSSNSQASTQWMLVQLFRQHSELQYARQGCDKLRAAAEGAAGMQEAAAALEELSGRLSQAAQVLQKGTITAGTLPAAPTLQLPARLVQIRKARQPEEQQPMQQQQEKKPSGGAKQGKSSSGGKVGAAGVAGASRALHGVLGARC